MLLSLILIWESISVQRGSLILYRSFKCFFSGKIQKTLFGSQEKNFEKNEAVLTGYRKNIEFYASLEDLQKSDKDLKEKTRNKRGKEKEQEEKETALRAAEKALQDAEDKQSQVRKALEKAERELLDPNIKSVSRAKKLIAALKKASDEVEKESKQTEK